MSEINLKTRTIVVHKNVIQECHKVRFERKKQGRKRPLDTPKRMIERRERERKVEGEI